MKYKLIILFLIIFTPAICSANRAGVAVVHRSGEVKTGCVEYIDSITGLDLLRRAGFNPKTDRNFIIEIDGESAENGWLNKTSNDYWFYWNRFSGDWQYSHAGAASYQVQDGELDGWQIGGGRSINPSLQNLKYDDVCKLTIAEQVAGNTTNSTVSTQPEIVSQSEPEKEPIKRSVEVDSNLNTRSISSGVKTEEGNLNDKGVTKGEKSENTTLSYVYILSAAGAGVLGYIGYRIIARRLAK